MTAPLSEQQLAERCVCQATPVSDSTLAEHAVWCPSRKPTAERLAEITAGAGRPLMAGELEWLRGDASRNELHVIGARGGHWPLTDDLPGAVLDLARKLGAMVAEVDRLQAALNQSENDLTGARLDLWEEEQEWTRLRLALASAQRGRSKERARVAELEAERHTTNEALDDAVKALRAKGGMLAAVRDAVAEAIMCADNECITRSHLPKLERVLGGVGLLQTTEAGDPS